MIRPQSARLKPTNNKARNYSFIALMIAVVLTAVYMAIPVYKGVVGLLLITALVFCIFIYTKYISPVYFYDIDFDAYGVPIFVVRQVTGRRQSTLSRISLSDITEIKRETAKERDGHKTPKDFRKYVYCPTLMPEVTYRLTVVNRYENAEIIIEANEEYAAMLAEYIEEAKIAYPHDEQ